MKSEIRFRRIFLVIGPLPALVLFKLWSTLGKEPAALVPVAAVMLIYSLFCLALALRWERPTYFDWAITTYFLAFTLSAVLGPESTGALLTRYATTGIYLSLFAAAFLPPMFGLDPLTLHYAKKRTPEEFWCNPVFITINRIMTFVWAGIFAACLGLSLHPSVVSGDIMPIALVTGVGFPFNRWFPGYYLKRLGLPAVYASRVSRPPDGSVAASMAANGTVRSLVPAMMEPVLPNPPTEAGCNALASLGQPQLQGRKHMKVIAINSSPRGEGTSKTEMMLAALVEGMQTASAEVEVVRLRHKRIKNCIGCFTCWTKTPGVCIHQDDMTNELFPKWLGADVAVYASPLYHYTFNAAMKGFIERTLPVLEPFLENRGDRTTHPLRQGPPKAVVLSVAGFPESSVFKLLSEYSQHIFGKRLIAEIYRPGAEALTNPEYSGTARDILETTALGGRELVQSMAISAGTMERITQPIGDAGIFNKMANVFWKTCIREGVTPEEFHQRNLVPRPDSIETFLMLMSLGFNPEGAAGTRAVIQFNFSGEVNGSCYFRLEKDKVEAGEGASERADLVIESPFEVWMDVLTGKAEGQQMFMERQFKAVGDLSLLIRMKDFFGKKTDQIAMAKSRDR